MMTEEERQEDHRQRSGLKCKFDGCENPVNSHKGLAGYCTLASEIREGEKLTHRQIYMRESGYKGKGNSGRPPVADPVEIIVEKIRTALTRVSDAENDLKERKEEWNSTLDELKMEI